MLNHGYCVVLVKCGFIYIGELITEGDFFTINYPLNLRHYDSGKGLLWHCSHGNVDAIVDGLSEKGVALNDYLKGPMNNLIHFIPTKKEVWYRC